MVLAFTKEMSKPQIFVTFSEKLNFTRTALSAIIYTTGIITMYV